MQVLLHVKVGNKLKKRMKALIDAGLFTNNSEIVREGLHDFISRYAKIKLLSQKKR